MQRHRKRPHNVILPRGRVWSTLSSTHYLLYQEIQTADDLCITSYCDNHSLLKNEGKNHTRGIDFSSWYTNPDHDAIMTVSTLLTKLPSRLTSIHVRAHQDGHCSPRKVEASSHPSSGVVPYLSFLGIVNTSFSRFCRARSKEKLWATWRESRCWEIFSASDKTLGEPMEEMLGK
jgi:hypothetical protein